MTRTNLHKIFESEYNHQDWLSVLKHTFGAQQLYEQPKQILLPNNNRATEAYELGNLKSSDDRIIGLYRINVKPEVWLERNKVSLRELLRNVYKYDVDGAIVVFVQEQKWRLSFISEIKVLNDEGEVVKQATESKRYTYLLGKDEKVKTPSDRLSKLSGKVISLKDILDAFSVEALNEEFYKIIQSFFYKLVGGKVGKGKRAINYGDGILDLPSNDQNIRQEFAVRLIGRTVFSWFLKMKKSDVGISLLPEHLLSSKSVKENTNYYHTILERLFFQTLNTPIEERLNNLPNGAESIPFLNGGLFEPNTEDYYKVDYNGINQNNFGISNDWFFNLFEELEKYNFTIDENSVSEIEVSVDPEMLGRIFENLLAEIDPDSGETARKSSGSFYTPREIVDYMATESLVQYIYNKTSIQQERLRPIFKMLESEDQAFTDIEKNSILEALDNVKILDPACGSGAFPMGILQKIVQALQKLDKDAVWWKKRQINRIKNAIIKKQLKDKLESSGIEYARKIGVIQNSLYGVDIQPVAAEISKLRCFLSLIVDENIDDNKPNRGIEPLPNLEFKFVTANTLMSLPEENNFGGLFNSNDDISELEILRNDYIQSYGKNKIKLKEQFLKVQRKIANDQSSLWGDQESKAYKLGNWNPFSNYANCWFDPKWMFGIEKFDIVIGNPPYVLLENTKLSLEEQKSLRKCYKTAQYKTDLFHLFFEQGFKYLKDINAILCYITPNTYLKNKYNNILREYILKRSHVIEVIRFNIPIFKNASVDNAIIIANTNENINSESIRVKDISDNLYTSLNNNSSISILQKSIMHGEFSFDFDLVGDPIIAKLNKFPPLRDFGRAYFGIQTFNRGSYVSKDKKDNSYHPVVDGVNVVRYLLKPYTEYVSLNKKAIKSGGNSSVYERERILVRQIGKYPEGCYCPPNIYTLNTIYNIFVHNEDEIKIKYLLSLINSSTVRYFWSKVFSDNKETFPKIKKRPLESIPIPPINNETQHVFCNIVDCIIWLKNDLNDKSINNLVSNNYISQVFEELIDAMVMELYFNKDFKAINIEFIKYAEQIFEIIEGKEECEQIKIINNSYQKLREKDNEIRNNLKLMDLKLSNITIPVKTNHR